MTRRDTKNAGSVTILEDQVRALAGLPAPTAYACVELSEMRREWRGVLGSEVSAGDSSRNSGVMMENERTPSGEGVSSLLVTGFQEVSVDVNSGGGGNCTRVPALAGGSDRCLSETALSIGRRMPQPRREYDGQQDHRASSCQPAKDGSDRSERAGSARLR